MKNAGLEFKTHFVEVPFVIMIPTSLSIVYWGISKTTLEAF